MLDNDVLNNIKDKLYITTFDKYIKLQQENKQLKDNWNDLKKYAKKVISTDNELYGTDLLDKIQELEQGSDSNVKD